MGSKNKPGAFDCYSNAMPDEPMFILLARDPKAPGLVFDWATKREAQVEAGVRPHSDMALVQEARECAANMRRWRVENYGAWRPQPQEEN